MDKVSAPKGERKRIEEDLVAHLDAAAQAGEPIEAVIERMGSPEEVAGAFMSQVDLVYAGFWRRLAAFLVDMIVLMIPLLGAAGFFLVGSNLVPPHPESAAGYLLGGAIILLMIVSGLAAVSLMLLYFPILEGRFGQTLGKRLLGMRVLKENGLPVGYREAFVRRISFYFDIFPFDAMFIPFTEKRQRGFDIIARTVVVIL
jgi:uncharacterized RDD family membrane protein YckC